MTQETRRQIAEIWQAIEFLWQAMQETWVVSDEKRRAFANTLDRIGNITRQYEHEWQIAAQSRTNIGAELDALEAEVNLLKMAIADLERAVAHLREAKQARAAGDGSN